MNGRIAVLAATLVMAAAACKKQPPAPAPAPAPAAAAPTPATAEVPATATPAALPAAVSVTAEPPVKPDAKPIVSVDIRAGAKMLPGLPEMGEAASFRMTLRDSDGQFISQLDPLLGGEALLVVARADLGWSTVLRADELSDKVRGSHDFRLVFPYGGIHRMWLLYSWHGKVYNEELSFSVVGKPWVGKELPESETSWHDDSGLTANLKVEPHEPNACEPFLVATAWTRKDKPIRMTAEPNAPTTWYIAIESSLGEIVTSSADPTIADAPGSGTETTAAKLGGDLGTAATLNVARNGRYRVLAIATPPGAKAGLKGATIAASFVISVHGYLHEGGCGK